MGRDGPLKGQLLYSVAKAILIGLAYIHGQRFAHFDIKPANILIDRFGRPKLADFGISRGFKEDQSSSQRAGTLAFVAPEIFLSSRTYDPFKADIWALGITFFIIATGASPWVSKDHSELRREICDGVFACPAEMPHAFKDLVRIMCNKNPEKRATAAECLEMPFFQGIDVKNAKLPIEGGSARPKAPSGQAGRARAPIRGGARFVVPKRRDVLKVGPSTTSARAVGGPLPVVPPLAVDDGRPASGHVKCRLLG
jgi:serine/threonine protein kinase